MLDDDVVTNLLNRYTGPREGANVDANVLDDVALDRARDEKGTVGSQAAELGVGAVRPIGKDAQDALERLEHHFGHGRRDGIEVLDAATVRMDVEIRIGVVLNPGVQVGEDRSGVVADPGGGRVERRVQLPLLQQLSSSAVVGGLEQGGVR